MKVQSASERSFSMKQIQKQIVPLKSSEVYISIDIKFVGVITKDSALKINSEMLHTMGIQCACGAMAQWKAWPTYVL